MKHIFSLALCMLMTVSGLSQTQQGYVKTIGRPDSPGVVLSDVLVQAKGMFNTVLSDENGEFSIEIPGKHDGDPIVFLRIQKNGYELKDKDFIGRQHVCSSRVPLVVLMVDQKQLAADKKRIEDNAYRVAEENYQKKLAELEQQKASAAIAASAYYQELQELERQYESYLSLIGDMADRYARTDYDQLDSIDYQINICIENGELDRADSLIHTVFDPETVLERNRAAKQEIMERIAIAQSIIDKANADKEAIMHDIDYADRIATLCLNLADEYLQLGQQNDAIRCLNQALDIRRIINGDDSPEVKKIQSMIKSIDHD